jgi:hypothetical protein
MSASARIENVQATPEKIGGSELHTQGHGLGGMTLSEAGALSRGSHTTADDYKVLPHMELAQDKSGEQRKGEIPITGELRKETPADQPKRPGAGHYAPITDSHEKHLI